ncbi:uncharacterized protein VTP21DRAFT_6673 [Calcarisporiella thermophila]|uniref:uncharacterized protein n=1 Tax=Calcarisporiella thermophila TaxID=911321 RepID=UPI003742D742
MSRGSFILFEGCDRAGKSTQCSKLVESLNNLGIRAKGLRFPDRTSKIGAMIQEYLNNKSEQEDHVIHLLFSANRWENIDTMLSLLNNGVTLVVDRWAYSGVAYSAAKGLDLQWCKGPDVGLLRPDLTFFMDLPIEDAKLRGDYGQERYENHLQQSKTYDIFMQLKEPSWEMIDARQSIEDIHKKILDITLSCIERCKTESLNQDLFFIN